MHVLKGGKRFFVRDTRSDKELIREQGEAEESVFSGSNQPQESKFL